MDPIKMLESAQAAHDRGDHREALSFLYNCAAYRNAGGPEPDGWHGAACALWTKVEAALRAPVATLMAA